MARARETAVRVGVPECAAVFADRDVLQRVLLDLLDDALRHGSVGRCVYMDVVAEKEWMLLSVEDEGRGVPLQDRRRVREPFQRLPGDPADMGAGLGLAVVRQLVELHGGTMDIDDARGGGAGFVIRLPRGPNGRTDDDEEEVWHGS